MMYGKPSKMSGSKMSKKSEKKGMPIAIMVAVGKPKGMPMRGQRTATNMMKKTGRGK
jgi:ribosomal protein S13